MGSGDYDRPMTWLRYAPTIDSTFGQEKPAWSPNGRVWCSVREPSGSVQTDFESEQGRATGVIKVRQYVPLQTLDRLCDRQYGETWVIDGVHRGDNEMILNAHRWEQQDGGL